MDSFLRIALTTCCATLLTSKSNLRKEDDDQHAQDSAKYFGIHKTSLKFAEFLSQPLWPAFYPKFLPLELTSAGLWPPPELSLAEAKSSYLPFLTAGAAVLMRTALLLGTKTLASGVATRWGVGTSYGQGPVSARDEAQQNELGSCPTV